MAFHTRVAPSIEYSPLLRVRYFFFLAVVFLVVFFAAFFFAGIAGVTSFCVRVLSQRIGIVQGDRERSDPKKKR